MSIASQIADPLAIAPGPDLECVELAVPLGEKDAMLIASGVLFLSQHSRLHANYPAEMLDRRIGPSLPLRQFRYYTDRRGVPVAFCSWVWLSTLVLDDVLATCRDLEADEFSCGDLPFFYEFLAPFGHCRAVARDLRGLPYFTGRRIPSIRVEMANDGRCVPRVRHIRF